MTVEVKLAEFVAAQNEVYDQVLRELAAGRKETHWIWFIFPPNGWAGTVALTSSRMYLETTVVKP
jgi:uncharacterized protein (DUF1810 family)